MNKERANTCGNCRWWGDGLYKQNKGSHDADVCRKIAPTVIYSSNSILNGSKTVWPKTYPFDRCGEWTMTEEAEAEGRERIPNRGRDECADCIHREEPASGCYRADCEDKEYADAK